VLVVDPTGQVTHRVSGPPAKAELLAAVSGAGSTQPAGKDL